jgi:hypothetical protein
VSAPAQLRAFIEKFETKDQRLIRAVRKAVRKRLPTAHELVYDNYNFFVIGYSPTERPGDAVISIAARANAVSLCFLQGARLPDPGKLLRGSGNQTVSDANGLALLVALGLLGRPTEVPSQMSDPRSGVVACA